MELSQGHLHRHRKTPHVSVQDQRALFEEKGVTPLWGEFVEITRWGRRNLALDGRPASQCPMAKRPLLDAEEVEFPSRPALRRWLGANLARATGIWAVTYKKAVADKYVSTGEIIQECLAHGWVDSLTRGKDDLRTMLWISPRKPGSNWSRVNKDFVAKLEADGLMTDAGRAVIERAKADGTWTALDDVENGVIPPDLQAAFDVAPGTEATWHSFPRSVRRGALEQLLNAKRPATRAKRIDHIIEKTSAGERPFQWR